MPTSIQRVLHDQGETSVLVMYAPLAKRPMIATGKSFPTLPAIIPHGPACSTVRAARSCKRQASSTEPAPMPTKSESRWT
jgi:hypothetical protein